MSLVLCNFCGRDRAAQGVRLIAHPDSRGVVRARLCGLCIRELRAKGYAVAEPKLVPIAQLALPKGSGEDVT